MKKIAILVDSGCDIPTSVSADKGIYTLPLKIVYKDRECRDGFDITPREVYEGLKNEIPSTSLPSPAEAQEMFKKIKADGYSDVLVITISSGLSGTHNMIKIVADDIDDMNIRMIDTKNIAIGSGFIGILAADLASEGYSLDELYKKVLASVEKSDVFFCVDTLVYLRKGGRIGLVSGILGEKLNLKPIISCNDDGIYHTVAKVRGKKQAVKKMIDLALKHLENAKEYNICISNGGAYDEIDEFSSEVRKIFSKAKKIYQGDISPTLGVHTGPGLLGLGVQIIE
ncbi:MAG: DegV family protein [Clostridia bacterium]